MKKTRKAISAPLGVIFGVLLAIILVVLATFIAFNISTTAVKSQSGQLVIVGQPVAFYDTTSNNLTRVVIKVKNPSGSPITIEKLIIKGEEIDVTSVTTVNANSDETIDEDVRAYEINVEADIANGYIDVVIVTDRGAITTAAQLIGVTT